MFIYGTRWDKNGNVDTISQDDIETLSISELLNSNYTRLILVKGESYTKEQNVFFKYNDDNKNYKGDNIYF